jgi:hypothetical protein
MRVEVIVPPDFGRSVNGDIKPIIEADLKLLHEIMVEEFNAPKHGRQYRRPGGTRYTASAPGEPPAIRTGTLERSISEPIIHESSTSVVGEIEIDAPYADDLEYGRTRVAARPFVEPAIEELLRRTA